jgi:hypothetical protein
MDFPKLSKEYLINEIFCGINNWELAKAYINEHMLRDSGKKNKYSNYEYEIKKVTNGTRYKIIRVRTLFSKHSNNIKYGSYIKYNNTDILGWYCTS